MAGNTMLDKRLKAISDWISPHSLVADIGTDHGWLPMYLVDNKLAKKVIATDVSENSLDKLVRRLDNIRSSVLETRVTDGLDGFKPFEVDTVVLSGMGGTLMVDILSAHPKVTQSLHRLILQPNVAVEEVRRFLHSIGFAIVGEQMVEERQKLYTVILAEKGLEQYEDPLEYKYSKLLIEQKHPLLIPLLKKEIQRLEGILREFSPEINLERWGELAEELNDIERALAKCV